MLLVFLILNFIETVLNGLPGIDVLVNNAGITKDNLLMRMSEEDFRPSNSSKFKICF